MKLRNKKTGKIIELECITLFEPEWQDSGQSFDELYSISELNENWEDYVPKEPLIRDKNERKAVRLWAYVNSIKEVMYAERPDRTLCLLVDMGEHDYKIQFVGWIPTLKDAQSYTIAELCGEEE